MGSDLFEKYGFEEINPLLKTNYENFPNISFYFDLIQKSEEWKVLRHGKITASKINEYFTKKDGAVSTKVQQRNAKAIVGKKKVRYREDSSFRGNKHTDYGNENEPILKEFLHGKFFSPKGLQLRDCGFVEKGSYFGFSPDALIFDSENNLVSFLEVKCPSVDLTLMKCYNGLDLCNHEFNYYSQIQFGMWLLGLNSCYFGFMLEVFDERVKDYHYGKFCFQVEKDLGMFEIFEDIKIHLENLEKEINLDVVKFIEMSIV